MKIYLTLFFALIFCCLWGEQVWACTSIVVSRGASADGSVMITYAADSHELYGDLQQIPPGIHAPGAMRDIFEWDTGKYLGQIPEVPRTFGVTGNMNERQVVISETTFTGRKELKNDKGLIDYGSLIYIALQRASSAREAIEVMTSLVREYGYYSTGEIFSIADPKEAWIMALIGKGPEEKGAVWVALRVPDGYVTAHANYSRIGRFPWNDPKNCLYAPDVAEFARRKGFFSGKNEDFSFSDAYAPLTWEDARVCEARVWAVFRRVAPTTTPDLDFVNGTRAEQVTPPLWIKPERKLTPGDVMELMRDHFEGTALDLSKGVGAGPYGLPYRWRPLVWKSGEESFINDRSTSTQQTGFSFISQSRAFLPDPIGGLLWFGVDDTYSTVYVPMYCGIQDIPVAFARGTGDFRRFSWQSAFWVFNWVANQAYGRYRDMIQDIRRVQKELEGEFLANQEEVEQVALMKFNQAPALARGYLTDYSARVSDKTMVRWRTLGEELLVKYMDGNVRNEMGEVTHPDYSPEWKQRILDEGRELYRVRRLEGEPEPKKD